MIVKTDDQSKLEELRRNKGKLYAVNTGEHVPTKYFGCMTQKDR